MKISHLGLSLLAACIAMTTLHAQDDVSTQWPDFSHAPKSDVQAFARNDGDRLWDLRKALIIEQGLSAVDDALEEDAKKCHLTGPMADMYVIAAEDAISERTQDNAAVGQ
jgi:hypothetical protein